MITKLIIGMVAGLFIAIVLAAARFKIDDCIRSIEPPEETSEGNFRTK